MTKNEFLSDAEVNSFIDWISKNLESEIFNHGYTSKKPKKKIKITSFKAAFEKYSWGKMDFNEDDQYRQELSVKLKSKDTLTCFLAAIDILDWGGVHRVIPELAELAANNSLVDYLIKTRIFFENPNFSDDIIPKDLKMNSGWTKIYACYCDNYIIYDGRVGAALAKIVYEKYSKKKIPPHLLFGSGEGANSNEPRRSVDGFPKITGKRELHIRYNIRANWLVNEVLRRNPNTIFGSNHRKFESALFMIGYDIRNLKIII